MTPTELETKLGQLLSNVGASRNLIEDIRRSTSHNLREYREDEVRHGGTGNDPFWDMLGFDGTPVDPCTYVFTLFRDEDVTIYVGKALLQPLILMMDALTPREVDKLEAQLLELAPRPEAFRVPRATAEHWLTS